MRKVLGKYQESVSVLSVKYHEALTDPVATAKQVNDFLGGSLNEQAMADTVDPGLRRQRLA